MSPLPLVFLGPSLPRTEAARLCTAEYHPPIGRGDLRRLAGDEPRAIGIVDGVFHQRLAVTPNEVLAAMGAGHRVYGAASMGALRAVELAPAGMVGVGRIFAAFASGEVERDDEVAIAFEPETGRALSEPLIGMRLALSEAAAAGVIDVSECERAVHAASDLHYSNRTWAAVIDGLALGVDRSSELRRFLSTGATDLKAEDARALLRQVARTEDGGGRGGDVAPPPSGYRLPPRRRLSCPARPVAELAAVPKVPGFTSVRSVPATDTDRVLARVGPTVGITRVANVTHLDTLGIPCFTAVCPGRGVSVYSGKSLDPAEARVGAQMEALEGALARDDRVPVRRATCEELAGRALDPNRLPLLGGPRADLRARQFDWVAGWDVGRGDTVWVPADAVFLREGDHPWHLSTNGLASGNCLAEALLHAMAEVVERDALTLYTVRSWAAGPESLLRRYPVVDAATLPIALSGAVEGIRQAGAHVDLRWVTSDVEVPTFLCFVHEPDVDGRSLVHGGSGTHPDAAVAARRAITEAAQSRATYVQGVREDLRAPATHARRRDPAFGWFDHDVRRVPFDAFPSFSSTDVVADLRFVLAALERASLLEVVAVDLSHPDVPLSVVRTIVPGAEAPFDLTEAALGRRASLALTAELASA